MNDLDLLNLRTFIAQNVPILHQFPDEIKIAMMLTPEEARLTLEHMHLLRNQPTTMLRGQAAFLETVQDRISRFAQSEGLLFKPQHGPEYLLPAHFLFLGAPAGQHEQAVEDIGCMVRIKFIKAYTERSEREPEQALPWMRYVLGGYDYGYLPDSQTTGVININRGMAELPVSLGVNDLYARGVVDTFRTIQH